MIQTKHAAIGYGATPLYVDGWNAPWLRISVVVSDTPPPPIRYGQTSRSNLDEGRLHEPKICVELKVYAPGRHGSLRVLYTVVIPLTWKSKPSSASTMLLLWLHLRDSKEGTRWGRSCAIINIFMGLNDTYLAIRSHIMSLKRIPTIVETYHMVVEDEQQRHVWSIVTQLDNATFPSVKTPTNSEDDSKVDAAQILANKHKGPSYPKCRRAGHIR